MIDTYIINKQSRYSIHNRFKISGTWWNVTGITATATGYEMADFDLISDEGERKTKSMKEIIQRLLKEKV